MKVYVDLDQTIIRTDLLLESLLAAVRQNPRTILIAPFWLMRGRSYLKSCLAELVKIDPTGLPYNQEVLTKIREKREEGCAVILATATAEPIAKAVADHLGLFDGILATTWDVNLKSWAKLDAIRAASNGDAFEYWGDSSADVAIFEAADGGLLVYPTSRVRKKVESLHKPIQVIERPKTSLRTILRAMRVHQWVKNLLLFVPIMTAHKVFDLHMLKLEAIGFLIFSLIASSHYLINDILDVSSDRRHATKHLRPIASGDLSIPAAIVLSLFLFVLGLTLSLTLAPRVFTFWVLGYFVLTNFYSFWFKQTLLIDLLVLASLYTIRIMAGGAMINIEISEWLLAFSMFFFASLAFAKRFTEMKEMFEEGKTSRIGGRAYQLDDIDIVRVVGPASGFMAILIMALYVNSPETLPLYRHPGLLWLVCPLLAYWILRIWFLANRGHLHHDPVVFALQDRRSYLVGFCLLIVLVAATL